MDELELTSLPSREKTRILPGWVGNLELAVAHLSELHDL